MQEHYKNQHSKLSGFMDENVHCLSARVYYQDCDAAGIVFHANYFKFAERGRNEFWNVIDSQAQHVCEIDNTCEPVEDARKNGDWALTEANIKFKKATRLGDSIIIKSEVLEFTGLKLKFSQRIYILNEDGTVGPLLCDIEPTLVFMTKDGGKAIRAPKAWGIALQDFIKNK